MKQKNFCRILALFLSFGIFISNFVFSSFADNSLNLKNDSSLSIVDKGYYKAILGFPEEKTVDELLDNFEFKNDISVYLRATMISDDDIVGTGTMLKIGEDMAYVVVSGDVNGDGFVDATDYLQMKRAFLGGNSIEGIYFFAADVLEDGDIDSTDYLVVKKQFLNVSNDEDDFEESTSNEDEASDEVTSDDESAEASSEETTSEEDVSEETTSEEDASEETTSEEDASDDVIKDQSGYEQFLKISALDSVLAERGFADVGANKDYEPLNYDVMKACWISQFDFDSVYYTSRKQRSESSFTKLVEQAYDNLLSLGFNTVIVQVRPNADSFYPSAYYPWSYYVLYKYGRFASYDPLKIMIDEAHERGISFHAWINPMRGMSSSNLSKISDEYIMSSWAGTRKLYLYDSINYLNIAYEDVRQLIIDGAAEIVRNYDVDGVHMDDYFYFGETAAFDNVEYNAAKASNSKLTLKQFRFNNLNLLVSGIYSAIKAENENVIFGISPAGNLSKMSSTYYADVETWLSEDGYVDYIMPQIYFGMEHETWSFTDTYERWSAVVTNPKINFICGMSLGKAEAGYDGTGDEYAGSGYSEWIENQDVFKKCFEYAVEQENFGGYAVFCYQYMFDPNTGVSNVKVAEELENCEDYMLNVIKGEIIEY